MAIASLSAEGWRVRRVGAEKRGYDLDCRNDASEAMHVEVKGTQGDGQSVILTRNEVNHNLTTSCGAHHALFVVTTIEVCKEDDRITTSGGHPQLIRPWSIDLSALSATEFAYRVPGPTGVS